MRMRKREREREREKGGTGGGSREREGVKSSLPVGRDVEMTEKMAEVGGAHVFFSCVHLEN